MAHAITALILPGPYHADVVDKWDLVPVPLGGDLTLFHLTHYYAAYRQKLLGVEGHFELAPSARELLFPTENVIGVLAAELSARSEATFALVVTDYFAGAGGQGAVVSIDGGPIRPVADINGALRVLGVAAREGLDEFDTVGLGDQRSTPDYLDRYVDLCDELGV
ncbi:hypothetical protein [Nocardia jinanensis]|uniref:Uncharacterized protein n=1 Tax=Nocardia jinanensis TaxID=382504 RepID=A0A917RUS2_9NOCA|nr:hypothetical protein [Nocardia jinanensis]GGL32568.1 hypothetical protein GCM10011588_54230 [Nocardia jinanensis]